MADLEIVIEEYSDCVLSQQNGQQSPFSDAASTLRANLIDKSLSAVIHSIYKFHGINSSTLVCYYCNATTMAPESDWPKDTPQVVIKDGGRVVMSQFIKGNPAIIISPFAMVGIEKLRLSGLLEKKDEEIFSFTEEAQDVLVFSLLMVWEKLNIPDTLGGFYKACYAATKRMNALTLCKLSGTVREWGANGEHFAKLSSIIDTEITIRLRTVKPDKRRGKREWKTPSRPKKSQKKNELGCPRVDFA